MKRRQFIRALAGLPAWLPPIASGQERHHIGVLFNGRESDPEIMLVVKHCSTGCGSLGGRLFEPAIRRALWRGQ